jgi:hypothetical protein
MRLQKLTGTLIAVGSALLGNTTHVGKTVLLDTLTGSVYTLPAAIGSGAIIRVFEKLAATSNSHKVQVANSVDVMAGTVIVSGTTTVSFPTVAASDTITLNRTTTGGATNGAWFEFQDAAPGIWAVKGNANGSGAVATPFSAAV